MFLVNSPEQRRLGIKDSYELAWQDWIGTAGFDRVEDEWARKWAQAYSLIPVYIERLKGKILCTLHAKVGNRVKGVEAYAR